MVLPPRWSLAAAFAKLPSDTLTNGHPNGQPDRHDDSTEMPPDLPPSSPLPIPSGWPATLTSKQRLTPLDHGQDVRHVHLSIPRHPTTSQKLRCDPGDCITIYPRNLPSDADRLIRLMGWSAVADLPLDLTPCGRLPPGLHAAPRSTLRDLILNNVDVTAVPRRSFLKALAQFSDNADHRERLVELGADPAFLDEYFDYATRSRRSILETLDEFTSVRVPAERLLDVFPLIRGRDFSIAGQLEKSSLSHSAVNGDAGVDAGVDKSEAHDSPTTVELLIALVKYRTILRRPREGVCSRYLDRLPCPSSLIVGHKPVQTPIHGPSNARRPLVVMATGTGLAPARSLIYERLTHYPLVSPPPSPSPSSSSAVPVPPAMPAPITSAAGDTTGSTAGISKPPPMLLFFGNRRAAADFFFEDEWRQLASRGLLRVFTAFSRDPPVVPADDRGAGEAPSSSVSGDSISNGVGATPPHKVYVQQRVRENAPAIAALLGQSPIFAVCGGSTKMADACKLAAIDALAPERTVEDGVEGLHERQKTEGTAGLPENVTWWQEIW